ncbi:MAG: hypothetical protein CMJ33_09285 [Phycisphaerae bacterium]|nr:hypothetical protein [Phycisphaerae bacterium]HAW95698.1 hypothetical protein [Phycisphaerales bacterium]
MMFNIERLLGGGDFDRGPEWRAMDVRRPQVQDLVITMLAFAQRSVPCTTFTSRPSEAHSGPVGVLWACQ